MELPTHPYLTAVRCVGHIASCASVSLCNFKIIVNDFSNIISFGISSGIMMKCFIPFSAEMILS